MQSQFELHFKSILLHVRFKFLHSRKLRKRTCSWNTEHPNFPFKESFAPPSQERIMWISMELNVEFGSLINCYKMSDTCLQHLRRMQDQGNNPDLAFLAHYMNTDYASLKNVREFPQQPWIQSFYVLPRPFVELRVVSTDSWKSEEELDNSVLVMILLSIATGSSCAYKLSSDFSMLSPSYCFK